MKGVFLEVAAFAGRAPRRTGREAPYRQTARPVPADGMSHTHTGRRRGSHRQTANPYRPTTPRPTENPPADGKPLPTDSKPTSRRQMAGIIEQPNTI